MVDASWSMATAERLAAAKGAVLSLLVDAYQRRDRVGLAVFRREGTEIVLPFTGSTVLAERRLRDIAVGGKTPLSHALFTADLLFAQALQRDPSALPLLVLLTDGAGNISLTGRAPLEEMRLLSAALRRRGVRSIVVDMYTRSRFYPTSPAAELAACLGGELCNMAELRAEGVGNEGAVGDGGVGGGGESPATWVARTGKGCRAAGPGRAGGEASEFVHGGGLGPPSTL
ncbi:MAG: VWA domain-containing protein [Anaerolineae bacterium]